MEIILIIAAVVVVIGLLIAFEYHIRQPDTLVLYESKGRIEFRKGLLYPRHFSLQFERTTSPIQLDFDVTAAGNLGVQIKLVGSVAPSLNHIQALIRVGGWSSDALAHAADEAQVLLEGMVKEFTEQSEIHLLSSASILKYINERVGLLEERLGVELITLVVQDLEPTDPEVADALRQREKARLLEETEELNQNARLLAAKAKYQTDQEIFKLEHSLDLKKLELDKELQEKEAYLAHQRLEDELERKRMNLAYEKEEVNILKGSPELLLLTPQAARLAEASQNLKSARTVISFTPQELAQGSELLGLFQKILHKAIEIKQEK
jgi:hypothetical protein